MVHSVLMAEAKFTRAAAQNTRQKPPAHPTPTLISPQHFFLPDETRSRACNFFARIFNGAISKKKYLLGLPRAFYFFPVFFHKYLRSARGNCVAGKRKWERTAAKWKRRLGWVEKKCHEQFQARRKTAAKSQMCQARLFSHSRSFLFFAWAASIFAA